MKVWGPYVQMIMIKVCRNPKQSTLKSEQNARNIWLISSEVGGYFFSFFSKSFSRAVFFSLSVLFIMPLFDYYKFTVNPIRIVSKGKHRLDHDERKTKTRLQNKHNHKIHYLRAYRNDIAIYSSIRRCTYLINSIN